MCGVGGILYKKIENHGTSPVGKDLVKMLESMTHRGHDSSGFTVVGGDIDGDLVIRIWTDDPAPAPDVLSMAEEALQKAGGVVRTRSAWGQFLRLTIDYEGEIPALAEAIMNTQGVALHSIGETSEVI